MTVPDAAKLIGISLGTMKNEIAAGRINYKIIGSLKRITREEIDAYLARDLTQG
jgi:excisionase family DNA binding protein